MSDPELLKPDRELPAPHDMQLEDGKEHTTIPPQKKNLFPLWVFPVISLFFVILAAGLYVKNDDNEAKTAIVAQPTTAVSPTPIDTKKWTPYSNEDWRISFLYPNDWKIRITSGSGELRLSPPRQRAAISAGQLNRENVENFINRRYRNEVNRTISRRVLANAPYKVTEYKIQNNDSLSATAPVSYRTLVFESSNETFFFEQEGIASDPVFDAIVSTFEFMEISGTPSPTVRKNR